MPSHLSASKPSFLQRLRKQLTGLWKRLTGRALPSGPADDETHLEPAERAFFRQLEAFFRQMPAEHRQLLEMFKARFADVHLLNTLTEQRPYPKFAERMATASRTFGEIYGVSGLYEVLAVDGAALHPKSLHYALMFIEDMSLHAMPSLRTVDTKLDASGQERYRRWKHVFQTQPRLIDTVYGGYRDERRPPAGDIIRS